MKNFCFLQGQKVPYNHPANQTRLPLSHKSLAVVISLARFNLAFPIITTIMKNHHDPMIRRPHSIHVRKSTGGSCRTVGTSSMTSCSGKSSSTRNNNNNNSQHTMMEPQPQHYHHQHPPRRESAASSIRQQQQQQPIIVPIMTNHPADSMVDNNDEDSLQDMLDSMIAETSAKWKSSVRTMQTSTMLQHHHHGWNNSSLTDPTTITPVPSLPLSRVSTTSDVEDLVRQQQAEIQSLRQALTTVTTAISSSASSLPPPISHVSIPLTNLHSLEDHDELTVDL